ncbi:MIP/aquaporin family protein [Candidatus Symbiopectobacterium sp. NZEC135]|uniref:MIP/aquaporin family protein n=1 Tax=Candidatus Symbiopectobacterium sp. NZEC135 TaxID=2820471 RepID=UPI002225CDB3|nr:MIP/aquaporin family protein [Candidatus Symbiopectobacterium sp. NZEC135]MCW2478395.1 aquaporin family protein [Candidatus Symbiopectobacterium sp. NZEC135]
MNVFLAELIGTMVLILLGNGVVANVVLARTKGGNSGWIVITAGWGFAVAIAVYITGWVSGAHLNPAVTFGMWLYGSISGAMALVYVVAQCIGAFLGSILVYLTYKRHYDVTEDAGLILATFSTGPAVRDFKWNLVTEIIGTAVLVFGVLGIFNSHNGIASGFGPFAVGILVYSIGLSLGGPTGYAINPARDLGPRIAHALLPIKNKGHSDWEYAWVPIVGPLIGGGIGALCYKFLPVFA